MDFDIIIRYIKGSLSRDPVTPALDKVLSNNLPLILMLVLILILIVVGKYAMGMKMFGKNKAWKAIIPFYGLMELYRAVDVNPWFAIMIIIPVVGLIPFFIFCFKIPKAFGQKIDMQILTLFLPFVMFNVFGFDKKYEYQYQKGKSVAFKDEFRTVMPEDADVLTPAGAVNGAAVSSLGAKESAISRAASAAAEQTRIIREEQEKAAAAAAAEQKRKEQEEEQKKAAKKEDFDYDIFNETQDDGPDSSSIDFNFTFVNGKFRSAPEKPIESGHAFPTAPATHPTAPATHPVTTPTPQPAPVPTPQPVPAIQPAPEKPTSGIEMTSIPPVN